MSVTTGVRRRRRRTGAISAAVLAVLALTVTGLAIAYDGLTSADVDVNDGTVWVMNGNDGLIGRVNVDAGELNAKRKIDGDGLDIEQSGYNVFIPGDGGIRAVDTSNVTILGSVEPPAGYQMHMGGDRVAISSPDGRVWILTPEQAESFSVDWKPTVTGEGSMPVVEVGPDGTGYVLSGSTLTVFPVSENTAKPQKEEPVEIDGVDADPESTTMTVVGDTPVILDKKNKLLRVGLDGDAVDLAEHGVDVPSAVLQQPGEADPDGTVLLADASSLIEMPLSGSEPVVHAAGGSGEPVSPVQIDGCSYGAWEKSLQYVRACAMQDVEAADIEGAEDEGDLELRQNNGLVILNDTTWGQSWKIMDSMYLVDDWEFSKSIELDKKKQEEEETLTAKIENIEADRDQENRPPTANEDSFGVRAGQSVVLPVLRNDSDPDGDFLTASVKDKQPGIGTVTPIRGGTQLQIDVAEDAPPGSDTFTYEADDGRGGRDVATVTLDVTPESENNGPVEADQTITEVQVGSGRTVSLNVLPYFEDPEGDAFYLANAQTDPEDIVTFSADGIVTFNDAGLETGVKDVNLTFRDEKGASSDVVIQVEAVTDQEIAPILTADHTQLVTGRSATLKPLENDLSPSGADLELLDVSSVSGLTVEPDTQSGTITIAGDTPGTHYLEYTVSAGAQTATGLIRVDIVERTSEAEKPVAVDDLSLVDIGTQDLVDPLENDVDPTGGVLVLNSIEVPKDSGLKATILNHSLLRVEALPDAQASKEPVELTYTVANGTDSTEGTVRVMIAKTDSQFAEPEPVADSGTVRAGDVISLDVLSNDHSPTASKLSLEGFSNTTAAAEQGTIENVKDSMRFTADPDASGEVTFSYTTVDETGRSASTNVTLTIVGTDEENTAPSPDNIEARTVSGEPVRIPIPRTGVDVDGDSVLLQGISSPPAKLGNPVVEDGQWIVYTPNDGVKGTDTFRYQVMDRQGAIGTGEVRVGIAEPSAQNLPPFAVDDVIEVRPDREVEIRALDNDTDPEGTELSIADGSVEAVTEGLTLHEVGEGENANLITVTTPTEPGTYTVTYKASDGSLTSPASITVKVDPNAPLRAPITTDDFVAAEDVLSADGEQVAINALDNDVDPDGSMGAVEFALEGDYPGVTVEDDGEVRVEPTEEVQRIRYTVTDQDDNTSAGYIWVPGTKKQPPQWIGDPVEVEPGATASIDLSDKDNVRVRPGAEGVTITDIEDVAAQHSDGGELVESETALTYTPAEGFSGKDTITVPVTDGAAGDETAAQGDLAIPIVVLPGDENRLPTIQGSLLDVEQGEAAATLDLASSASDPDGDELTFAVDAGSVPEGIDVSLSGASTLTASADKDVLKNTIHEVTVSATDGKGEPVAATVQLTVTGSKRPLVAAGLDVVEIDAGKPEEVDVLANDSNPFSDGENVVTSVGFQNPDVIAEVTGGGKTVTITPPADFHGVLTGSYTVEDATGDPDRQVSGQIRVDVIGKPERPSAARILEVGNRTVQLKFEPGEDNGAPIEHYTVTTASGDGVSQECASTTCVIEGLENDVEYTFQVTATNRVGESDPSTPSPKARPDVKPEKPAPPKLTQGDKELKVTWVPPVNEGSAIRTYQLQIIGGGQSRTQEIPASSTSYTWAGLENGTDYRFRVRALNDAEDPSDWSENSASEHPAGPPQQPSGTMTADRASGPLGGQIDLSWPAMSEGEANGEAITGYIVKSSDGQTRTIKGGDKRSYTWTGLDANTAYTFSYVGVNSVSKGTSYSAASKKVTGWAKPSAPTGVAASMDESTNDGPNGTVAVSWKPANGNGTSISEYVVRWNGGSKTVTDGERTSITGLQNGTSYRFTVQAKNRFAAEGGESDISAQTEAKTPYTKPGKPSLSMSNGSCSNASTCPVSFSMSENGGGGVGVEKLQYRINGGEWQNYNGKVTKNLGSGDSMKVDGRVVNVKGKISDTASGSQTAKTYTPPTPSMSHDDIQWGDKVTGNPKGCKNNECWYFTAEVHNLEPGKSYEMKFQNVPGLYYKTITIVADGQGNAKTAPNENFYGHWEETGKPMTIYIDGKKVLTDIYSPSP